MTGRKEEKAAEETLFGKYQLCHILGRGRSGTVYLARHLELEEYRAIKQVPKTCTDYEQFRKEALILKTIRHPGIPIVYDLEEDENYSYLIEEYLEGDSLYALISDIGHFSKAMTLQYGIQICRLVSILHSAKPTPILYLDLQPKNLLICHDTVKLIDFDHAVHLSDAGNLKKRYGTIGCAAPEQYTGDVLDERTDIYAIGAVLYYMLTGHYPKDSDGKALEKPEEADRKLMDIIGRCLSEKKEKRFETADELCSVMESAQVQMQKKQRIFKKKPDASLMIAVAGSRPGAGATHTALGLVSYLRRQGISAVYEELNGTGAAWKLASWSGKVHDKYGIFFIRGLPVRPQYGEWVKLEAVPYPVRVLDCGYSWDLLLDIQVDMCLLVCGAKPWEIDETYEAYLKLQASAGVCIVFRHFSRSLSGKQRGEFEMGQKPIHLPDCFLLPEFSNPFRGSRSSDRVYERLLNQGEKEKKMWKRGGWVGKLCGKGKRLLQMIGRY